MSSSILIFELFFLVLVKFFSQCLSDDTEPTFRHVTSYNKVGRLLTKENLEKNTVNVLKPIIFIINGLDQQDVEGDAWYKDLMDEYLEKQIHNVFLVDWKFDSKSHASNQFQSTGYSVADFIQVMFDKTREPVLDIHLVGVLAGSQVAGIAGKRLSELTSKKVNRITALDPTYYLINDKNADLGRENANFVDVVHSNTKKFGKLKQDGDVRFYVVDEDCIEDFGKLKAVKVFAKSINSDKFRGVKCESVEDFKAGKCRKNDSVVFGENVDKAARGNYFVAAC